MYQRYFGLQDTPFSIAPDPRFLYLSEQHREALAHLLYGVGDQGGFVVLTGEVGTGKTTVCRCLLQQLPSHVDIAFIVNPRQSAVELLQSILHELGVPAGDMPASIKPLVDRLNERLLASHARGRNTILIIDEAQNLSSEVLEQLRLLTNLETSDRKLLQLILLGQPELNDLLHSHELRQLAQRVTARYHLRALSRPEVAAYIRHRLAVAGCRAELFSPAALRLAARRTGGVPRLINLLCDRALLGVYASGGREVTRAVLQRAAREVLPPTPRRRGVLPWARGAMLATGVAGALILAAGYAMQHRTADVWPDLLATEAAVEDAALAQLQRLWDVEAVACEAMSGELFCQRLNGDARTLLERGRPAVVELEAGGVRGHALLLARDGDQLTLQVGDQRVDVSQRSLRRLWRGHALLLDPLPPGRNDDTEWLRSRLLAHLQELPEPAEAWRLSHLHEADRRGAGAAFPQQHFAALEADPAARERALIRQFQQREKLQPSGELDAATRRHLRELAANRGPRLASVRQRLR